ncbi:hypothetical protein HNY73_004675 [Argiope bruennichi]|uniref:Uncharacterized protein n=1 Tax=Argiope bruennichi TaxID=94029 RepID=A0A8T0FS86_ARGBR|nr:hypothetical protein HNY73_004675 [Argiope bruennichi]
MAHLAPADPSTGSRGGCTSASRTLTHFHSTNGIPPTSVIYGGRVGFDVDDDKRTLDASEKETTAASTTAATNNKIKD